MSNAENPPIYNDLMALKPPTLTPNAWAVQASVSRTVWADMKRHGNPTRPTLEKLLRAIGSSLAEFEGRHALVRTEVRSSGLTDAELAKGWYGDPKVRPVPLVGSAIGGVFEDLDEHIELTELHLSEILDHLSRPYSLANDDKGYAVTIVGESMAPRFEPGERAFVSPRLPVRIGDDVIVQLRGTTFDDDEGATLADGDHADRVTMVLIKRLVRQSAKELTLRQFNPDMTFSLPLSRVACIHKVVGRL